MASIGGNVLQRTRCAYFRDVSQPCNKRRNGEGCSAIGGDDRKMAILGATDRCIATHPSDFAVAMLVTDATIHIHGPNGDRTTPFLGFHRVPGDDPTRDTNLNPGELIVALSFAPSALTQHSAYVKVRDRASYEFALVSAAAGIDVRGGIDPRRAHRARRRRARAVACEARRSGARRQAADERVVRRRGRGGAPRGEAAAAERLQGRARAERDGARARERGTRCGMIGAPQPRVDGRAKVTGSAKYSYEEPIPGARLRRHGDEHDRRRPRERDRRRRRAARAGRRC